jgi:putative ABC transport system permease protein
MTHFVSDVRFALRKFMRAPILTLAAIVTLALGIGANTAIFSMVDGIWLRPLPIADPAHLIAIESIKDHAAADSERTDTQSSFPEFLDVREQVPAFVDVAASSDRGMMLETADGIQLLTANVVNDNYFTFMGVRPELGRLPNEDELRRGEAPVVVLSHGAWQRVFGGDSAVVGSTVKVRGGTATILGVLPAEFRGTERVIEHQVYVPEASWFTWNPEERMMSRSNREHEIFARLRSGATLDQARAQLQSLSGNLAAKYPQTNHGRNFAADWQVNSDAGPMKKLSLLLLAIASAVLMIACTNIANLLMALNDSRRREIAMRVALGATRGQLIRQLATEYTVLALGGIAVALVLAQRLIALVPALTPVAGFPLSFDFRVDHRVMAFACIAGVVALLFFGLVPAIASTRISPIAAMRAQILPGSRLKMPARKIFIVAQLSVSMALLMATGLLVRALLHIENMNMGFNNNQNAALVGFSMDESDPQQHLKFEALAARVRALPGVKDASVARIVPFSDTGSAATRLVLAPGEAPSPTAGTPVWFNLVDDAYFRTMGVSIVRGRAFDRRESPGSPRVVIVNQTMAMRLFGTEEVVGKHLRMWRQELTDIEIVGVAQNGIYADLAESPQPYMYLPLPQYAWSDMELIATTAGDPRALLQPARRVFRGVDPNILVTTARTLNDHMRFTTYTNRMAAWLTASLGALALLLTMVGLYGVTAYSVSRRTHEIGIRMALGALRESAFTSVLKDGLKLTFAGVVLGTGIAVLLGRLARSLVYGVKPMDLIVLSAAIGVVVCTSLIALIPPARRALRVDPVDALREE